jgi:hypothetical protein
MNSIFLDNLDIYYINLEHRKDRDKYMKDQFLKLGISRYNRIEACTKDKVRYQTNKNFLDIPIENFSTIYSHIFAIKNFINYGENDYCLILEDDVNLLNLNKINFNFKEIFNILKFECLQLSISSREDLRPIFVPHVRTNWDFGCIAYIINKDYGKKILKKYLDIDTLIIDNFISKNYYEYRDGFYKNSLPSVENVIYGEGKVLSWPLFSYIMSESSINNKNENIKQNLRTIKMFDEYWSRHKIINIQKFKKYIKKTSL